MYMYTWSSTNIYIYIYIHIFDESYGYIPLNQPFASLANTEVRRATAAPAPSRAVLATTPAKAWQSEVS